MNVFPNSTKIIVDVNLGNNTIEIAREELLAAFKFIGWDKIRALECKSL